VSIDGWGNRLDNPFLYSWGFRQPFNFFFALLSEPVHRKEILLLCDIICFDYKGKDRKSILCVRTQVKIICTYADDLNFFPRACTVNQIIQQYHFLVSWKPTCRRNSRAFLECKLLVIPVYCLFNVNSE